jgi:hypothetical protein
MPEPNKPTPPSKPSEPAAPTAPEPAAAPAGREESHAEKLYRAQSVELEALRRQLEAVPDADSLATIRAKAEQFDQLAGQLPEWRQKLSTTFEAEQQALRQQVEQQQKALTAKERETTAMKSFLASGGRGEHWNEFHRLIRDHLQPGEDGELLCTVTGESQPLEKALKALSQDAGSIWPSFFRPAFGSGSGAKSVMGGRAMPGPNLHGLSTSDKFRAGFLNTPSR